MASSEKFTENPISGIPYVDLKISVKQVEEFIHKKQIPSIDHLVALHTMKGVDAVKTAPMDRHISLQLKNGGLKIPHLHLNDHIYMLDQEQWREFSGMMLAKVKEKIAQTNSVSFEQLAELSSVTGKLT
ncbi:hypothetical protein GTO89_13755 [Heliobacterium gestii]|uniref:Uncharacterized protein n=1 Tax=Heliomicrobium gestii TaxID=2699 RepID=A0A845LHP0_HELGE|nr:hypothetical protein [Heliomicrobium gestii]MBM7867706.1 hypothetical protein [Heliomicrobium gestii]MZP44099.1 hypothetical protein [Heliomicrobium gestii]